MIKIVGAETGKVYAEGYREDCFRELQKKYPYKTARKKVLTNDAVYQETLLIIKEG